MVEREFERFSPNTEALHAPFRSRSCFVREMVSGTDDLPQHFVYEDDEVVREEVGAGRMHVCTLGNNEGDAHVHWHVVPLPPGVPHEEQQSAWASRGKGGLRIPQAEMSDLAGRIRRRM